MYIGRYIRVSRDEDLVVAIQSRLSMAIASNQKNDANWNRTILQSGKYHIKPYYV